MIRKILLFCLFFILIFFTGLFFIKISVFAPTKIFLVTTFVPVKNGELVESTPAIIPTPIPTLIPTSRPKKNNSVGDTSPWGIATQIGEHTWTMKVGEDSKMATAAEILKAVNDYRQKSGSQILVLDSKLTAYAQSRADFFYSEDKLDSHVGFINFLDNEDGFNKLGFSQLGENASLGYQLNGVHLIEWVYAGDDAHNKNQLNNSWDHVGIGVKGTASCLIFATGKF